MSVSANVNENTWLTFVCFLLLFSWMLHWVTTQYEHSLHTWHVPWSLHASYFYFKPHLSLGSHSTVTRYVFSAVTHFTCVDRVNLLKSNFDQNIGCLCLSWFSSVWYISLKLDMTAFWNSLCMTILTHTKCRAVESVPDSNPVYSS
jgi:hypothetical protein